MENEVEMTERFYRGIPTIPDESPEYQQGWVDAVEGCRDSFERAIASFSPLTEEQAARIVRYRASGHGCSDNKPHDPCRHTMLLLAAADDILRGNVPDASEFRESEYLESTSLVRCECPFPGVGNEYKCDYAKSTDFPSHCHCPCHAASELMAVAAPSVPSRNDIYLEAIKAVEVARDDWDARGRKHWWAQVAQEVIGVLRARAALPSDSTLATEKESS